MPLVVSADCIQQINTDDFFFPHIVDCVFLTLDVPLLHDCMRSVGDGDGPVFPLLLAVGSVDSGRAASRRIHRQRLVDFLLVRHRSQHGGAHLTLRQRRSHPVGPVLSHQLGPADVLREVSDAGQGPHHDAERGARPDRVHLLRQNGDFDAEHYVLQQVLHRRNLLRRRLRLIKRRSHRAQ